MRDKTRETRVDRRKLLRGAGTIGTVGLAGLAGCNTRRENVFRIDGFGVVRQGNDAASYVTLTNVSDRKYGPDVYLATFDNEGVRVSDWRWSDSDPILSETSRRIWQVWDTEDSGWFSTNDLGQSLQAFETKMRIRDHTEGPTYGGNNVGDVIGET